MTDEKKNVSDREMKKMCHGECSSHVFLQLLHKFVQKEITAEIVREAMS